MAGDGLAKACSKCGETKPASADHFRPARGGKLGLRSRCRPCEAQSMRDWRAANPDKARQWDENNREYRRAYLRGWYKRDPQAVCAKRRARYRADAEFREARLAQIAEWKNQNRHLTRAYGRNRRAREKNAQGTHTAEDVAAMLVGQRGRCWWCSCLFVGGRFEVDHRFPLATGGSNGPENIVLSCPTCNRRKSDKMPWQIENPRLL